MDFFQLIAGDGPLVAAAIHAGHDLRPELLSLSAIDDSERLREEDPFTDFLSEAAPTRLIGMRSRFEVDLNRPREQAVYAKAEDCWGLEVWRAARPSSITAQALDNYDLFYAAAAATIRQLATVHKRVVVLDLHSYNHRRDGAEAPPADASENPEVNIGTGTMDRQRWAPVVDRFIDDLRKFNYRGRSLDVRENVRFRGGNFVRWIHATFPDTVCGIAVEFKKFFMDEWTGEVDRRQLVELKGAIQSTIPGLHAALSEVGAVSSVNHSS